MRILFPTTEWPFPDQPYRGPFAKAMAEALSAYHEVIPFPLPVRRNPLNVVKYRYQIARAFRTYQATHIHAYALQTLWMINPARLPVSVSLIGSDVWGKPTPEGDYPEKGGHTYRWLKNRMTYLKGIRTLNQALKEQVQNDGFSHVPVWVIPDGIAVRQFPIKSRLEACHALGWDPDAIHIFFPGNPNRPVKNHPLAAALVDPLKSRLNVRLHTHPQVPHNDMNNYYRAADMVLITSFHEGSSNALKEALLCETPVISTDAGDAADWLALSQLGNLISYDIDPATFENLVKHNTAIKRKSDPGLDKTIAEKAGVEGAARALAEMLDTFKADTST